MYADNRPCEVCGAPVSLRERAAPAPTDGGPVGPPDGVVGSGDPTTDERLCSNELCPTRRDAADAPRP